MTAHSVYALKDPRTDEIHYIGQSNNPDFRLKQHLADTSDTPKVRWLDELLEAGLEPRMQILESGLTALEANESESWWISEGVEEDWPLTNQVNGKPRESNNFSEWLAGRIERQGCSIREFAKQAGLAGPTISNVLNGYRNPGSEFCTAIATALNLPPEFVFRKAGLLPPRPEADDRLAKINTIYHALDARDRSTLLRLAEALERGGDRERD